MLASPRVSVDKINIRPTCYSNLFVPYIIYIL